MKNKQAEERFDCLEFKRRAQEEIIEETRGMSPDEEIEYFRRAAETGPLGELWKSLPIDPLSQLLNDSAA